MRALIVILTFTALVLGGCGQKGPLYREAAGESGGEETREDED